MRGIYKGDLVDGIRHGSGVLTFVNGDRYEGEFRSGFRHGRGVFTSERGNRVYDGEWQRSVRHGQGTERWLSSGDRYEGTYAKDAFHGKGLLVRGGSGTKYEGEFAHGRRHGRGRMEFGQKSSANSNNQSSEAEPTKADLKAVLGGVAMGRKTGSMGQLTVAAPLRTAAYVGEWHDGRMHGQGKYTRPDGSFYEGTWANGQCHGTGREVSMTTGEVYEGGWRNGMRHGDGVVIRNGKKRRGQWEMGQRVKWTTAEMPVNSKK